MTAFFVSGCDTIKTWTNDFFGPATTSSQQAFRLSCEYAYLSIPAANYAEHPSAKPLVLEAIRRNEARLHNAMVVARGSLESGNDAATASLSALGSTLASFSLQLTGSAIIPDNPEELAGRAIVIGSVVVESAAEMRMWRKSYCQRKLEDFNVNNRDPAIDEWAEVDNKLQSVRSRIQGLPE